MPPEIHSLYPEHLNIEILKNNPQLMCAHYCYFCYLTSLENPHFKAPLDIASDKKNAS